MAYICLFKVDKDANIIGPATDWRGCGWILSEEDLANYKYDKVAEMKRRAIQIFGPGNVVAKRVSINILGDYVP